MKGGRGVTEETAWSWLLPILATLVINGLGAVVVRGFRADTKEATSAVEKQISELKLDLANHYVRQSELKELRDDNKKLLRKVTSIQILIARHLGATDLGNVREEDLEG